MTDLEAQLGLEHGTVSEHLAELLVDEDSDFLANLVKAREESGLTVSSVAQRMGVGLQTAIDLEAYWADPPLSLIRRYAHAIGVSYSPEVFGGQS